MGWQPEQFNNRYAFLCGVAAYLWQSILSIQTDLVVGMIKAALFGVAGIIGKDLWSFIKKACVAYLKTRKSKKNGNPKH